MREMAERKGLGETTGRKGREYPSSKPPRQTPPMAPSLPVSLVG